MNKKFNTLLAIFDSKNVIKNQEDITHFKKIIINLCSSFSYVDQIVEDKFDNSGIIKLEITRVPEEGFRKDLYIFEDWENLKNDLNKEVFYIPSIDILINLIFAKNVTVIKSILEKYYYSRLK